MIGRDEAGEVERLDVARLARQDLRGAGERALPVAAPIVDGGALEDQAIVEHRVAGLLAERVVEEARRAGRVAALLVQLAARERQLDPVDAVARTRARRVIERLAGLVELPLVAQQLGGAQAGLEVERIALGARRGSS